MPAPIIKFPGGGASLALGVVLLSALQGISAAAFPDTMSVGWRFKVGEPVSQTPAVNGHGIYAVTDRGGVVALNSEGVKRWTATLPKMPRPPQELFSTPPLWVNGLIIAGTDKGLIYAFDSENRILKWKVKIGDDIYGALNWMKPDDKHGVSVIALSRNNGSLYRLDLTNGRVIWASKPCGRSDGSPAVGTGLIVFGGCDSALHYISADTGDVVGKTEFEERGPVAGGVTIDGNQAFVGTRDGSIVCADLKTFCLVWTNRVAESEIFTTPAVTADRIVAGSNDGSIYCLNRADGKKIWSVSTQGNPTSPLVVGDQVVVTSGGALSLLKLADGKTVWIDKVCDSMSPPAVTSGKMIVGTDDGYIVLFQPASQTGTEEIP
ncbi:MAG: PQQ-binding-like beta-propeller repeat protein [bacterium]